MALEKKPKHVRSNMRLTATDRCDGLPLF